MAEESAFKRHAPDHQSGEDELLFHLKLKSGKTWSWLAEATGITEAGLRRIRLHDVKPRWATLLRLERALGVERGTLLKRFEVADSQINGELRGLTNGDVDRSAEPDMVIHAADDTVVVEFRKRGKTAMTIWIEDSLAQVLPDDILAEIQDEMRVWVKDTIMRRISERLR